MAKAGLVGVAVAGVGLQGDRVVGPEFGHAERSGADRLEVGLGAFRRPGAETVRELRLLQDRRGGADEGAVGIGLGDVERDLHGQIVQRLDRGHVGEFPQLRAAAGGIPAVFGGERDVDGGHRAPVGPEQALPQRPDDALEVGGHPAVGHRRRRRRQPGNQISRFVEPGERLQHHRRGLDVLGPSREVGIHDRRGLPVDDAEMAVASPFLRRRAGCEQGARHGHRQARPLHAESSRRVPYPRRARRRTAAPPPHYGRRRPSGNGFGTSRRAERHPCASVRTRGTSRFARGKPWSPSTPCPFRTTSRPPA